eukprot:s203_g12.t1
MIWSSHDLRERHLEHGAYLRIEVPPVSELDIDTRLAVGIARECGIPTGASLSKRRKTSEGPNEAVPAGIVARGAALLQLTFAKTQALWEEAPARRQHSATFSSLRAGHGGPRPRQVHRRPPPHNAKTDWLTPLGMLFLENFATEYAEEGPVIYVNTWFLHHRRYRRLSESRMLRLDDYQDLWYNDICELWSDILDPTMPATVHLVQPSPPEADAPRHVGHLLLVQGEVEHAPVLFTALFDHPVTRRIWHLAALIPRHLTGRRLCSEMELARWCSQRLCRVRCGEAPVPLDQMTDVQDGDSVVITITTLPALDDTDFPEDQVHLMQTFASHMTTPRPFARRWSRASFHVEEALDVPAGNHGESQGFCFNPRATAFHPQIPLLGTQSEFVQELHVHWDETAFCLGRRDEDGQGRSAVTTLDQIYGPHLIAALGVSTQCFGPDAPVTCWIWHRDQPLLLTQRVMGRCGYSFTVQFKPRLFWQPPGVSLLQTQSTIFRATSQLNGGSERLTDGRMAFNRRPDTPVQSCPDDMDSPPQTLHLDALLPPTSTTSTTSAVAFRLIAGTDMGPLPSYVECSLPGDEEALSLELCAWGHHCDVFRFGERQLDLCVPHGWYGGDGPSHYMFCHSDLEDEHGAFLHTADRRLTEIELMQFLYQCGYWRASILAITVLDQCLLRVDFANVVVQLPTKTLPVRETPAWPPRAEHPKDTDPFFVMPTTVADDDCIVRLGLTMKDLTDFFCSAEDILCRDPEGHGFPEHILKSLHISDSTDLNDFDRILIYTDGSSQAMNRHKPPLWNAEQGFHDTWAFVVVGERYADSPQASVIGWIAHPVHYEEDSQYFLDADQIGSYIAEREALTWAGPWRLARNTKIDTIFRTDSLSSAQQARGDSGCAESGNSFKCFRGVFQALESALPAEALSVEHIHGHSNELHNDLADFLAK